VRESLVLQMNTDKNSDPTHQATTDYDYAIPLSGPYIESSRIDNRIHSVSVQDSVCVSVCA